MATQTWIFDWETAPGSSFGSLVQSGSVGFNQTGWNTPITGSAEYKLQNYGSLVSSAGWSTTPAPAAGVLVSGAGWRTKSTPIAGTYDSGSFMFAYGINGTSVNAVNGACPCRLFKCSADGSSYVEVSTGIGAVNSWYFDSDNYFWYGSTEIQVNTFSLDSSYPHLCLEVACIISSSYVASYTAYFDPTMTISNTCSVVTTNFTPASSTPQPIVNQNNSTFFGMSF
jgi:hypothetical protein